VNAALEEMLFSGGSLNAKLLGAAEMPLKIADKKVTQSSP
jgi:hypothetical protein